MKKVLVVYYSQSGQLLNILQSLLSSLAADDEISVTYEVLKPDPPYPFPWEPLQFFDVMPESVREEPVKLEPFEFDANEEIDLIILAYQIWFLSPSIPMSSFLQTAEAARLLKGKPVITIIGCRNMWLMGQERVKERLKGLSAQLLLNLPFVDRCSNAVSLLTTPAWMFSGKRDYFTFLPKAGVSEEDINNASRFGEIILEYLQKGGDQRKGELSEEYLAEVNPRLIGVERAGRRVFTVWAKLLSSVGGSRSKARRPFLRVFIVYLALAITFLFPINYLLYLFKRTLNKKGMQQKVEYYAKGY